MSDPFTPQEDSWPLGLAPSLGNPLPQRMLALTIRRDQYGPPSRSVRLEAVPAPRLKPNEAKRVLVAILATGPNFNTNFAALGLPVPVFGKGDAASVHVPGSDALGIVVDAGPGVSTVKVGQAVILDSWTGRNIRGYETHDGFNAQFAVVDEERAVPVTGTLRNHTPERLAAMLLTYGTAYRAVAERLSVRPGDTVLVMGGGKGTSFPGAQIAKSLGARVLLVGSNPDLARDLIARGMADSFVDRRSIPKEAFGAIPAGMPYAEWKRRTEPFRRAVLGANGGKPVDKIFEHTGGENFPLLISALSPGGTLAFFGATGKGMKGEYKETFFHGGRRFVMDARWVWMRQKQVLFRRAKPASIFDELGLPPGRRVLVWGADREARKFVAAARARTAEVVVLASATREKRGIAELSRMGVPPTHILDRDAFSFPEEMPDPLTPEGRLNPEYASGFTRPAQALGKALWKVFGPRVSPDVVVDRVDQDTLHFSTFVARDFDEKDVFPCGAVVLRGKSDLTIRGSHMYGASQAADVIRLLSAGKIAMDQEDLEITDLRGLPVLQQRMLDGTMRKPKGVALVQADRPGRTVADYEDTFRGEVVQAADPGARKFVDVRLTGDVAVVTLTRPDSLNALSEELLTQFAGVVREAGAHGTIGGRTVKAIVLTGAGRSFVAGADVKEFHGKTADVVDALAWKNISVFTELEHLALPVVALVDGFALGGGNELAMSAHYRIVTENAVLGQPEVKLGIIPGYGGMQRLPRLIGPTMAAQVCVNGEPVDGSTSVALGWADEFVPSSSSLPRAVAVARDFAGGGRPVIRRDWDTLAGAGKEELARLLARPEVITILEAPTPGKETAGNLRAARLAAARDALLAMKYGYEHGFEEGLRNDARMFGAVAASPGGQEWVGRFLAKDGAQSSFLTILPPAEPVEEKRPPISKKAPGDRPISFVEIGEIASILKEKMSSGGVTPLPKKILGDVIALLKDRPSPAILAEIDPSTSGNVGARIASLLTRGKISVRVVDLGPEEGFRRENARPTCEVLLVEKDGEVLWEGKNRFRTEPAAFPRVFLPKAFLERNASRPHVVYQAIVHPILEWVFGYPHMIAVLCESAYNATPPDTAGSLSDLNRYIAEGAGRDSDFPYFDRILVDAYEPEDFRKEELSNFFGGDEGKVGTVLARAREMGVRYRERIAEIREGVLGEIAAGQVAAGRAALEEGDAERALHLLRKLVLSPETPSRYREEAADGISVAIRSYALGADPAFEGVTVAAGEVTVESWAGPRARDLSRLLSLALSLARTPSGSGPGVGESVAGGSVPRIVHVVRELERPSGKFIDGNDGLHWVFEKGFVLRLLSGMAEGTLGEGIPALLACRLLRDASFPDEKLSIERQYSAAVKGTLEAYRFFQSLPEETRKQMTETYARHPPADPLFRLFASLETEGNPARASHMIRNMTARTHSYGHVRYPDTALAGKVVVITGGGTGMGRSLALEAARRGGNVVITGRRPAPLLETKADMDDLIRHLGLTNQTLFVQGDVSDPKYVGEMFEQIEKEFGRIDVLYNNAGVSGPVVFGSAYEEGDFDEYREAVNVHLTGSWMASLEAARIMEGQPGGGTIVMVGTFYSESIHHHVLHAYPGRLPYTTAQSAKLALGDYLAWALAGKRVTVLSLNPSAVSTERIQRGSGVFDKGSKARARIGRNVPPEALERDTLERTVGHAFVDPRDFAALALEVVEGPFRRTIGGGRLPVGGVTYEQPPGVFPSPAALSRYPDLVGKVVLLVVGEALSGDVPLIESSAAALARSGAAVILSGGRPEILEPIALKINARGGEGTATVSLAYLSHPAQVQELFDSLPRIDLLLYFTGSVDWKRPLTNLPHDEWTARVDRFGLIPRFLCWQAERRMDRDGIDGTIVLVGPDLSGAPTIRERNLVQVFQAMLRPAVATEAMERALMRKATTEGTAPGPVANVNIGLVLPGRTDGRNRQARPEATAASVLWFLDDGKRVSGAVLLPDEQNAIASLPLDPVEIPGTASGKVAVVTGGIRNLGKEISLRLAAERATVVIGSRYPPTGSQDPAEAEKARGEFAAADLLLTRMRRSGGRALWVHTDVARPGSVRALLSEARNRFGRVDLLVNNAGAGGNFSRVGEVMRDHRENFAAVLAANFLGPWEAIVAAREILRSQPGGGSIVNVSTHYADHPYLFRTIYTVSKILLKALAKAARADLAADGISITDIAPTLIAGPRMEWVMRNYATKFSAGFDDFPALSPAARKVLTEGFLRSFDGAVSSAEREAAAGSFLAALRSQKMAKDARERIESWYGRIGEWFRSTVPAAPPRNEEVAEAVLFAAKDGRFLENPFLAITTLPPFSSFPPSPGPGKVLSGGEPGTMVSTGDAGALHRRLHEALSETGARVTSLSDAELPDGQVRIRRPAGNPSAKGARGRAEQTQQRALDLSDPRIVEPWLDNALVGAPPPAFVVLIVGATAGGKDVLDGTGEDRRRFLEKIRKTVTLFAESARAVRDGGHLVVVGPPETTGEGLLVLAALRQTVRTFLAEQHFLPASKSVRVSLLAGNGPGAGRETEREAIAILEGARPPRVEPVPLGYVRP
ncbi:SDR family NAD(P)-dependent oxidoreductase [Candidatus Deferrimicrobium sp.]|uniref:SDR family NAD(P)-dependent oxidoreductase n=1 Tax=Candidatus Deferrimicrobium sp. TaxID=3060586 RepID=UPI003C35A5B8